MKNIIIAILFITVFGACNSKKNSSREIQLLNDSTAYKNDMYSDTGNDMEIVATPVSQSRTPRSVIPKTRTSSHSGNASSSSNVGSGNAAHTTTTTQNTRKKGWSSAAKGAVIGGGVGAIGGAIISKKPVKGAIIGGVVGAAGGYIIGKDIDKRKGR